MYIWVSCFVFHSIKTIWVASRNPLPFFGLFTMNARGKQLTVPLFQWSCGEFEAAELVKSAVVLSIYRFLFWLTQYAHSDWFRTSSKLSEKLSTVTLERCDWFNQSYHAKSLIHYLHLANASNHLLNHLRVTVESFSSSKKAVNYVYYVLFEFNYIRKWIFSTHISLKEWDRIKSIWIVVRREKALIRIYFGVYPMHICIFRLQLVLNSALGFGGYNLLTRVLMSYFIILW